MNWSLEKTALRLILALLCSLPLWLLGMIHLWVVLSPR